jgi:hypothetical protein
MINKSVLIWLLFIAIILSSCQVFYRQIFGVDKEYKSSSYLEQKRYLERIGVDTSNIFFFKQSCIDSLAYLPYKLDNINDTSYSPVQFRIYKNDGQLHTAWQLCFGDLEKIGILSAYPPNRLNSQYPISQSLNISTDTNLLISKGYFPKIARYDYIIVGFWSESLGKKSTEMLKIDSSVHN